mgnify:FL=1
MWHIYGIKPEAPKRVVTTAATKGSYAPNLLRCEVGIAPVPERVRIAETGHQY